MTHFVQIDLYNNRDINPRHFIPAVPQLIINKTNQESYMIGYTAMVAEQYAERLHTIAMVLWSFCEN